MNITHVMRSQEFLSSIPKFLAAHEALGLPSPINATLPQVLDETGTRKLSKRLGAKPILEYREAGFLPEAMLNFLATIGWNDGTEQEIYTVPELIEKFSLDRVQKSGGIFDEKRLVYLNGAHIRRLNLDELFRRAEGFWPLSADSASDDYKKEILALVHERLKYFGELAQLTNFFFEEPAVAEDAFAKNKQLKKLTAEERHGLLQEVMRTLGESDFTEPDLEEKMRALVEILGAKPGVLFGLVRVAITGSNVAPGLFETMRVLGKQITLARIKKAAA
jgi:glutamyl-tRNA synthetase